MRSRASHTGGDALDGLGENGPLATHGTVAREAVVQPCGEMHTVH